MIKNETYAIPENLLQALVGVVNELPAGRVRGLLNAVENLCMEQDKKRADDELAELKSQIQTEIRAEANKAKKDGPR